MELSVVENKKKGTTQTRIKLTYKEYDEVQDYFKKVQGIENIEDVIDKKSSRYIYLLVDGDLLNNK